MPQFSAQASSTQNVQTSKGGQVMTMAEVKLQLLRWPGHRAPTCIAVVLTTCVRPAHACRLGYTVLVKPPEAVTQIELHCVRRLKAGCQHSQGCRQQTVPAALLLLCAGQLALYWPRLSKPQHLCKSSGHSRQPPSGTYMHSLCAGRV